MKHRSAFALGLGLALLGGCAITPKPYERPGALVADAFPGGAGSGPAASEITWQDFYADARLRRLIEISLADNRDLRVAVLTIELSRAQYQIRRADELPTVNAAASATRQPGANGSIGSTYLVGLALASYEVDLYGRIRNLSDAALAQFAATGEAERTVRSGIVASVATLYLSQLADDEQLALTRQTLATRDDSLRLTRLKFDVGVIAELDVRQAESLVESARATLAQQLRQRALDDNAMQLLVGGPLPADLPPGRALAATTLAPELDAGLPSDLLLRRPEIRQSEQLLRAADANIGAARAAFFPRISLTGSVGVVSGDLKGLFTHGQYGWSFAPQIVLPIFDAGRNRANLDVANVGREQAVAQYDKAVQSAFRDVADTLASRATLAEQVRAQQAQADAEAARFRLSDLRYRNGVASYLDLLDAQRSLFTAQLATVQVRLAQLQNQVALYQALGGGWSSGPVSDVAPIDGDAAADTRRVAN